MSFILKEFDPAQVITFDKLTGSMYYSMCDWGHANSTFGEFHSKVLIDRDTELGTARFYFADERDATVFSLRWVGLHD